MRAEERPLPVDRVEPERPRPHPAAARDESRRGPFTACTGLEALRETEQRISGPGAVERIPAAEGLAALGARAAVLPPRDAAAEPERAALHAPWVLHRIGPCSAELSAPLAFELIAEDAQRVVDHALVAHHVTRSLGAPGACVLDRATAEALTTVRLPGAEALTALPRPGRAPSPRGARGTLPPAVVSDRIDEAFEIVGRGTSRGGGVLSTERMEQARYAFVAAGAIARESRRWVESLRHAGVPCGLLTLGLLHPFPAERIVAALRNVRVVLVAALEPDTRAALAGLLAEHLPPGTEIRSIDLPHNGADLAEQLARALELAPEQRRKLELSREAATQPALTIGVRPPGARGRRLLLDLAGRLGQRIEPAPGLYETVVSGMTVLAIGREPGGRVDVLLTATDGTGSLDVPGPDALSDEGTLVLYGSPDSMSRAARRIEHEHGETIRARRIVVRCLSAESLAEAAGGAPPAVDSLIQGALLACHPGFARLVGVDPRQVPEVLGLDGSASLLENVDARDLPGGAAGRDELRTGPLELPGAAAEEPQDADAARELRRFHVSGRGAVSPADPLELAPLRPAILEGLRASADTPRDDALVFPDSADGEPITLGRALHAAIEGDAAALPLLAGQAGRLVRLAADVARRQPGPAGVPEILERALEEFPDTLDLSTAGREALQQELATLRERLTLSGSVIGLGPSGLPQIYLAAVRAVRRPRRAALVEELRTLAAQLDELLKLDASHSPEGSSPRALGATLGAVAGEFVDPSALSRHLPAHRGSRRLAPARRRRIERVRDGLRSFLSREEPDAIALKADPPAAGADLGACPVIAHPDGLAASIGVFDALAARWLELVRALRTARLEVRGEYDDAVHAPRLEALDWQALTAEELLLLPPVVVLESGRRIRDRGLASLSGLLRSGRPVHVLVTQETQDQDDPAGYQPGLGYLMIAHREAFVVQSSLARPEHLAAGLTRMLGALGPAAALVAIPAADTPIPHWLQLAAAEQSRGLPCFRYDPAAGETWAERFDLSPNLQIARPFPVHAVDCRDADGAPATLEEPFTFAHAAALDPALRGHFRVVPRAAWSDDQVEIGAYLALAETERRRRVPFLWVVDARRRLARAVITRELAFACRDRHRFWRILQELAGTDNEHARRAAEQARADALAEAGEARKQLEAQHSAELERVRNETAGEAMQRLAEVLLNVDTSAPAAPRAAPSGLGMAPAAAAPAEPAAPEAAPAEPAEKEEEEPEPSFDEPYIDSPMCTTCNECTDLNGRMFKYDGNRQAYIADAAAGTFEQLIWAAEKCPARCIHPGAPRPDDPTVTDELIERAKPFN